jgi:hypothetical protein
MPDKGGVLHKRSGPQGTRMVNTKTDHPSQEPRTPTSRPPKWRSKATPAYTVRQNGMPSVRKPCQLYFIGRCRGQRRPSTSPPMRGSMATELGRSRRRHHRKASRAPATEGTGYKDNHQMDFTRPQRRYFIMGLHMSCNRTRVRRKLYHS